MKVPTGTVAFVASCILAISPGSALAQHGSSGHSGSAGAHSSSSSHSGTGLSSSTERPTHTSVVVVSGRSDREAGVGNDRWPSDRVSSSESAHSDQWLKNNGSRNDAEVDDEVRPANLTIGFPESGGATSDPSVGRQVNFADENSGTTEGQVQRGTRTPVPVTRPSAEAPRSPSVVAPPLSSTRPGTHVISRIRSAQIPSRHALWFLAAPPPGVQAHVFRRRFFGGFGYFGLGLPFAYGFGPDCNPFWAEPFAFGCNTFGYFGGYGGYGFAPEEQENLVEPSQEEGQQAPIFVPEQGSSPEEIQAEKVLFVLYMKNGALYAVTNYWIEGGKLHYLTSYGGENTIDMNDLDLQKTVDVNAKRGLDFSLKPRSEQPPTNDPQQ